MLENILETTAGGSASKGCDFWCIIILEGTASFKSVKVIQLLFLETYIYCQIILFQELCEKSIENCLRFYFE